VKINFILIFNKNDLIFRVIPRLLLIIGAKLFSVSAYFFFWQKIKLRCTTKYRHKSNVYFINSPVLVGGGPDI
jgi:hypothetical protein